MDSNKIPAKITIALTPAAAAALAAAANAANTAAAAATVADAADAAAAAAPAAAAAANAANTAAAEVKRPFGYSYDNRQSTENRRKIDQALEEDAACRHRGVTKGLYGIDDLGYFYRMDHGYPTIVSPMRDSPHFKPNRAQSDSEFAKRLAKNAPFFEDFDFKKNGFVLAGGSVSALLMNDKESVLKNAFHDWDMFLVGHAGDDEAFAAITDLSKHLYAKWGTMDVYHSQGCITFCRVYSTGEQPLNGKIDIVQCILRRYNTAAEVVHGFDMGSSAILWDGEHIFLTALGKLAAEHGINVLNLVARRSSYEMRLTRYFNRGYELVLPNLSDNLSHIQELPYLYLSFVSFVDECCSCKIQAGWMAPARPGEARVPMSEEEFTNTTLEASDYAAHSRYGNDRMLFQNNFRAIKTGKSAALCAKARYEPGLDLKSIELTLDLVEFTNLIMWKVMNNVFPISSMRYFLGEELAGALILEALSSKEKLKVGQIQDICAKRLESLKEKICKIPFQFMQVEDGTALTGPFPRQLVTEEEWYGKAYLPRK